LFEARKQVTTIESLPFVLKSKGRSKISPD